MKRVVLLVLALSLFTCLTEAQFGGRDGDVVIYSLSAKGDPTIQVVPSNTVNSQPGLEIRDPLSETYQPFGPDFPAESYVTLHTEPGDSFRFIRQHEGIEIQHNQLQGPAKLLIAEGMDRLLIPNKDPIDLTAGLYAPFPQGVDFGPELPIFEAHSFLWTPSPIFPLLKPADPSFTSPLDPPGLTGSEYVLQLGQFLGLIPWVGLSQLYPNTGWEEGIDQKLIDEDTSLGATVRLIRLRPGRKTPIFRIAANTHLAVLSGSVQIAPPNGPGTTLNRFNYAFVPNNFAITLSNPKQFDSAGAANSSVSVP